MNWHKRMREGELIVLADLVNRSTLTPWCRKHLSPIALFGLTLPNTILKHFKDFGTAKRCHEETGKLRKSDFNKGIFLESHC
jgi:hypothetical protein